MWFYFRSMEVYLKTMMIFLHLDDDIHLDDIHAENIKTEKCPLIWYLNLTIFISVQ